MKLVVYGAGAMGSFIGGLLSKKHEVCLIGREWHVSAVRKDGLRISGLTNGVFRPGALSSPSKYKGNPDLVLLTTKAYDTEYAAKELAKWFPDVPVLSFQNGLNNVETLERHLDATKLYAGTTTLGVTLLGPGQIRHAGTGSTSVGALRTGNESKIIEELASALTAAGMRTSVSDEITIEIWRKGIVNAGINPVTAIAQVPNGQVLTSPELKECAIALSNEAEQVAIALGHKVSGGAEEMLKVASRTAHNRSSMLQDIDRKKRTEIGAITGVIASEGERLDIDVRYNEVFLLLVKGIERTFAFKV